MPNTSRTAIAIITASFLARLLFLDAPELLCQEAYYWNYASHLDFGYIDHPPMIAWLISFSITIFGHNEFAVRFPALLLSASTGWFVYRLAELVSAGSGLIALLFFSAMPYFFGTGFFMSPDAPLVFFWAASLYYLYIILSRPIPDKFCATWLIVGLCLGLGMISKYTISLVGFSTLLLFLFKRDLRGWLFRIEPYLGALITLLCFTPVLYWNATHQWASFAFQGPQRFQSPAEFGTPAYLLHLLALATPPGVALTYLTLRRSPVVGVYGSFARFYALTPVIIFFLFSFRHETKIIWSGPALLALLPGLALSLQAIANPVGRLQLWTKRTLIPFLILTVVGFSFYFLYAGVGIPGLGYKPTMNRLIGWEDLGKKAFELARAENAPLIIGMDKHYTAAELGFYVEKAALEAHAQAPQVGGRPIVGLDGLMWHFWLPRGDLTGKDAVLVARGKSDLEFPELSQKFQSLEPITEFRSTANGKEAGRYFIRRARAFRGASVLTPSIQSSTIDPNSLTKDY